MGVPFGGLLLDRDFPFFANAPMLAARPMLATRPVLATRMARCEQVGRAPISCRGRQRAIREYTEPVIAAR